MLGIIPKVILDPVTPGGYLLIDNFGTTKINSAERQKILNRVEGSWSEWTKWGKELPADYLTAPTPKAYFTKTAIIGAQPIRPVTPAKKLFIPGPALKVGPSTEIVAKGIPGFNEGPVVKASDGEYVHPGDLKRYETLLKLQKQQGTFSPNLKYTIISPKKGPSPKTTVPKMSAEIILPKPKAEFKTDAFSQRNDGTYGPNPNYIGAPPTKEQKDHYGWLNQQIKNLITPTKAKGIGIGAVASFIGLIALAKLAG